MTLVHSVAQEGSAVPTETEASSVDIVVRLCGEIHRLKCENAALKRDLARALKPRNLKPLRESYARLLHRPSVTIKARTAVEGPSVGTQGEARSEPKNTPANGDGQ